MNSGRHPALIGMTDAADYFLDHAKAAAHKARGMQRGAWRNRKRRVARVYHLLAKRVRREANGARTDDFRTAKQRLDRPGKPS